MAYRTTDPSKTRFHLLHYFKAAGDSGLGEAVGGKRWLDTSSEHQSASTAAARLFL